jgi:hypothetical protein
MAIHCRAAKNSLRGTAMYFPRGMRLPEEVLILPEKAIVLFNGMSIALSGC